MNRRQFVTAAVAAPLAAMLPVAASQSVPGAIWTSYPYWITPGLEMYFFTVRDRSWDVTRCGMHTFYLQPDASRVFKTTGNEVEFFTDPRELKWAREFYPEAFK